MKIKCLFFKGCDGSSDTSSKYPNFHYGVLTLSEMLGLQVYFLYFKTKIRRHTVVWQGFLTQKDGKDTCKTGVER